MEAVLHSSAKVVNAAAASRESPPPPEALRVRDAAWHEASIHKTLSGWNGRSDVWIFGYGSLIWRPEFDFVEARRARIHGYHRSLCLWSRINRGTPDCPGLVFSLDLGGSCTGRAYRIAGARVAAIMPRLWAREMPSAAYIPRWLNCHTKTGVVPGLVFTMDRTDRGYVPGLSLEQTLAIVHQGHGRYGRCLDYVLQTADALVAANINDPRLQALARALRSSTTTAAHESS
ncbi:MAG TPA: gamma-glutamylcyclotransferase [Castellaniella sp.]|uniref:gamma-glutamylcyclotransferase n=1 Tax=Castellaniella sp. TaxID=1955812 RepID=UPI002EDBC7A8